MVVEPVTRRFGGKKKEENGARGCELRRGGLREGLPCVAAAFTVQRILCRVRKWNVLLEFSLHKIERRSRNFENCFNISIVREGGILFSIVHFRAYSSCRGLDTFFEEKKVTESVEEKSDTFIPIQTALDSNHKPWLSHLILYIFKLRIPCTLRNKKMELSESMGMNF